MKPTMMMLLFLLPSMLYAGNLDDKQALADLTSVKIVCDVNVGEAKLLLRRLELIDETYSQLLDAGVTPTVVVAFRGGASQYVTQGDKYVCCLPDPGICITAHGLIRTIPPSQVLIAKSAATKDIQGASHGKIDVSVSQ